MPEPFIMWLAEQLAVSTIDLAGYAQRQKNQIRSPFARDATPRTSAVSSRTFGIGGAACERGRLLRLTTVKTS